MENYKKGKNVEQPLERCKIPIPNLPDNFLWMQVRGGSKIRNLLTHALNELPEVDVVVWTGFGPSVGKAITCAEIMKREFNNTLHQVTKLCHRLVEEYWDPIIPEIEQLVVKRKLPMIHICLSKKPFAINELGYQTPGIFIPYNPNTDNSKPQNKKSNNNNDKKKTRKTPTKEFAEMQMEGEASTSSNKGTLVIDS